jgi:opacity protein-like surface antigen
MDLKTTFRRLALMAVCLSAFIAQPAAAQTSRIYFAGYLGLNNYNQMDFTESSGTGTLQVENGKSFAGALGIRLTSQLRLEGEYSYSGGDISRMEVAGAGSFDSGGEIQSKIVFANLYYDFDVPWAIQPFVGGGLGYGWNSAEINDGSGLLSNASADASGLMWNLGGGFEYHPRSDLAFTAGYRFVDAVSDQSFGNYDVDLGAHEFRIGVEWDLPVASR